MAKGSQVVLEHQIKLRAERGEDEDRPKVTATSREALKAEEAEKKSAEAAETAETDGENEDAKAEETSTEAETEAVEETPAE